MSDPFTRFLGMAEDLTRIADALEKLAARNSVSLTMGQPVFDIDPGFTAASRAEANRQYRPRSGRPDRPDPGLVEPTPGPVENLPTPVDAPQEEEEGEEAPEADQTPEADLPPEKVDEPDAAPPGEGHMVFQPGEITDFDPKTGRLRLRR